MCAPTRNRARFRRSWMAKSTISSRRICARKRRRSTKSQPHNPESPGARVLPNPGDMSCGSPVIFLVFPMKRFMFATVAIFSLTFHFAAEAETPKKTEPAKDRYETRKDHDEHGTGKFYMGREIA